VEYVADTPRNPFGLDPPCERFVPGYGDTAADFHVIGDHPGVHGGLGVGIPFTDRPWSADFFDALARGGLFDPGFVDADSGPDAAAGESQTPGLFLSYLHMCDPGEDGPTEADYAALEPFFDAELRAITAHVLLPVGPRATAHVLREYTSRSPDAADVAALHAREIRGAGWLVVPVADPSAWTDGDAEALADAINALRGSDYRQVADLGRFLPDDRTHVVR
jgi:uracil-DNA glycosylase